MTTTTLSHPAFVRVKLVSLCDKPEYDLFRNETDRLLNLLYGGNPRLLIDSTPDQCGLLFLVELRGVELCITKKGYDFMSPLELVLELGKLYVTKHHAPKGGK